MADMTLIGQLTLRSVLIAIASCVILHAQTPATSPVFEAVSIKPSPPPGSGMIQGIRGGPGTRDPGLVRAQNFSLFNFLEEAYDLEPYRISVPEWTRQEYFDMSARVPPGSTRQQYRLMVQNMLKERFALVVHHEKKQSPGYDLVVAKNGPRLTSSAKPAANNNDGEGLPFTPFAHLTIGENGFPVLTPGKGPAKVGLSDGHTSERVVHKSMERFAGDLSVMVGRPVRDETGLAGEYDFELHWISRQGTANPDNDADTGPDIFRALQEQLGLKLAPSSKGYVDVLVVDHVSKAPTDN